MTKIKSVDEAVGEMTKHTMWRDNEMKLLENRLNEIISQDRLSHKEAVVEALEGKKGKWLASYMPSTDGEDPSKFGFDTEQDAWNWIKARLTPCPLDPRDTSGEPCDSCMAEWMIYQVPEVDQALDQAIAIVNSIYKDSE